MSKFTAGTWLAVCHGSAFVIKTTTNQYIASVDRKSEDNMANATLISFAPDMLEALKQVERGGIEIAQLRRLIAKAEGSHE